MKKIIALVLALILVGATFTGCSGKASNEETSNTVYIVGRHANAQPPAINNSTIDSSVQSAIDNNTLLSVIELDGSPTVAEDNRFTFTLKKNVSSTIKKKYVTKMTNKVIECFNNLTPKVAEVDVLKALEVASNELKSSYANTEYAKHIVVYSTGVQTTGLIDMTKFNILSSKETVDEVIEQLSAKQALPNLEGITIDWYNLNQVSDEQKELTAEMEANNEYLWGTLIAKAGGKVDFKSDNATADDRTNYDVGVSVVPVIEDSLNVQEYNKDSSVVFTTDEIAFKSDSVEFVDEKQASQAVTKIINYMLYNKDYNLLLAASTATVPPQNKCESFSKKRAEAVKSLIISRSDNQIDSSRITTIGMGYENPYHVSDTSKNGSLIEEKAKQNRAVYAMNIDSPEAVQVLESFD
ncbi:MAG: OmpA family protein [Eubacterium coprostanoligenes]|uniref:OmpA family protein n=1 Tax=Eubacterium coprostanoligenes TaxID=290054 RepID=UPI002409098A|nr:OmpA family protein [Eubacterium coprostanoligenes]MDD6664864.1 OmpA family protein [Eubacterium coprostanoligenes]